MSPQHRREFTWPRTSAEPNRASLITTATQEKGFVSMKINKLAIFSRAAAGEPHYLAFRGSFLREEGSGRRGGDEDS